MVQFNGWCDAGGKPDLGLMRRRECERRMFLGAPLQPTRMQVWALSEAVLLPLYEAATADAVRWRDAPVAPAAPTETTDDLNAASAAGTLDIGADS